MMTLRRSAALVTGRTMPVSYRPQQLVYLTAAAAFGTSLLSSSCIAYSPLPPSRHHHHPHVKSLQQHFPIQSLSYPPFHTTTRFYSSSSNDNDDGIWNKVKKAAKKVLPFLKTDEEKQAAIQRKQVQQEIKGGLQEVLKDAPLPIKMIGGMIAPLLGSALSTVSEEMGRQQAQVDSLLQDAQSYLVSDVVASQALGEPITIGTPFQQGSSTVMINGKTSTQIQAAFQVQGSKSAGVARMDATQDGITSLMLDVNGRRINVNLMKSGVVGGGTSSFGKTSRLGKNTRNTGDIIDVEFVEKKETDK